MEQIVRFRRARPLAFVLGLGAAAALAACGGSGYDGGNGNGGGGGGGGGLNCTAGDRVDISGTGATPACLRVEPNTVVTIANGQSSAIEVRSAPHPTHGSCPELDATPEIPAGGSIQVTMVTLANCSFHDHLANTGTQLGVIQVASANAPPDPYPSNPGY
jgi:hypothetical protein